MNLADIDECTGCGACASVCAKGCIKMVIGENGFYYPQVDTMKCVECGLCSKNCHVLNKPETQNFEKLYYCGWETSETKRVEGSSGGVFGAIAEKILSNKGIVYGAALSSDKKRLFHCSTKDVSLEDLKKSKYLESDMGNTTSFIRKDIKEGKTVLFCGTPCQVYGVRKIFGYKYENLELCDFLCHGVPSQVRYQQYLKELETKYDSPIKNVGFRTKRFGWKTYCIVIDFENGKQYVKLANEDPYYKQFFSNINLRHSCYTCNRAANSVADITFGDFWGAKKKGYNDDDKGISLIVCNTEKGQEIVSQLTSLTKQEIKASDVEYAFAERKVKEKHTLINAPFFDGFNISTKDIVICAALKNRLLRNLIYRIL